MMMILSRKKSRNGHLVNLVQLPPKISCTMTLEDFRGIERNGMSRNNPVGNIPIHTPMLRRIYNAAWKVYEDMTESEVKALDKEIKSVTETNCNSDIYDMAKMLEHRVDAYCKRYLFSD